ncbi:MAG: fused MFS/spermidine synthase [Pseudomonadota bacterium]
MNKAISVPMRAARASIGQLGASPYVAAVFLSAALVFLVQPMFAKMATPLLGGASNVWNVSLVCFQAALLLGYAYAHYLHHAIKSLRVQIGIHAGLLALAALVLPFQLSGLLGVPDPNQPTLWLIGVFAISIAPPFAVIAATAPLIQYWYSRSGREDAHDPYHLYSASNIGSLIGLIAYPLVLEPLLPVAAQASTWSVGYGVLAILLLAAGLLAYSTGGGAPPAVQSAEEMATAPPTQIWKQRAWWLACAFVPSSLLVGCTTYLATDVASAPFLWALPLILYIGTFIIVFAKTPVITLATSSRLLPAAIAIAIVVLNGSAGIPLTIGLIGNLLVLFLAALVGHGMLANDRPEASRLTEFYLVMSLGGVLGGAFNALLAPVLFNSVLEYPLMLLAILMLRPGLVWIGQGRTRVWPAAAIISLVVAWVLTQTLGPEQVGSTSYTILAMVGMAGVVLAARSRIAPVICGACALLIGGAQSTLSNSVSERSFFGVVKVAELGDFRLMMHGTTVHGAQYLSAKDALRPTTYYAPEAPIGQTFVANKEPGHVGVLGLGTGSVACHARPGQTYTYYEIDPLVAKIAADPAQFTYLSDCTPDAEIVLGDGRLTLADAPQQHFNLLLIDAFSSDSIPTHLLTVEAVELYLSRLSTDGILVLHVSNRHLDLTKVVARISGHLDVPGMHQFYRPDGESDDAFRSTPSDVVVLSRSQAALDQLNESGLWTPLEPVGGRPWSDDYSNVIGAMLDKHR